MWVVAFQIATIFSLLAVVICVCMELHLGGTCSNSREILWSVHAERVGPAANTLRHVLLNRRGMSEVIWLPEDTFLMGNRMGDDIYLDAGHGRVKLYLNVQKDRILLSVLKGRAMIHNRMYEANSHEMIEIFDFKRVVVEDIALQFQRKKGM